MSKCEYSILALVSRQYVILCIITVDHFLGISGDYEMEDVGTTGV